MPHKRVFTKSDTRDSSGYLNKTFTQEDTTLPPAVRCIQNKLDSHHRATQLDISGNHLSLTVLMVLIVASVLRSMKEALNCNNEEATGKENIIGLLKRISENIFVVG